MPDMRFDEIFQRLEALEKKVHSEKKPPVKDEKDEKDEKGD